MSRLMRSIKNVTNGYSSSQVKVRNITKNNEESPSTAEMQEIAELTYANHELFLIMDMIDKRLNDKGKYWRHVYKSLVLLDYLVHYGSDNVIIWCRENLYIIKTLREFQHVDEHGQDQGTAIRARAKELTSLLQSTERLRAERAQRREPRRRRSQSYDSALRPHERPARYRERPTLRSNEEGDEEIRRAIELSKESAAEDARRRAQMTSASEEDIQRAIELSRQNASDLFNGNLIDTAGPYPVHPVDTGYLQYGYNQFTNPDQVQAYHQAQTAFQAQQAELQRQYDEQQNQIANLEQQLQATQTGIQSYDYQQQQQLQQQQQQEALQEQLRQQQLLAQQAQQPLQTGSNNPFAAFSQQQAAPVPRPLVDQSTGKSQRRKSAMIAQHAEMLEGVLTGNEVAADSFGNTGSQSIPAQHTNSKFINSAGHGLQQMTSNNPFMGQQYTGIATTQIQPAHTGYGFGNDSSSRSSSNLIDL